MTADVRPPAILAACHPEERSDEGSTPEMTTRRGQIPRSAGDDNTRLQAWTVGHSNHSQEKFLQVLGGHNIELVIDARRFPASRKWPHFNAASLANSLPNRGIAYAGMPELGGRRRARPDSPHSAWRVEAFRGYADFMDTPDFTEGLEKLTALARGKRAAVMCAEALPWRCHRSLIADALTVGGWEVFDILSEKEARPHKLPDFARIEGTRVVYDGGVLHLGS